MAVKATSCSKGQIAVRSKEQATCVHHRGKTFEWFCETCHDVICVNCISSIHKSHSIVPLSDLTPINKHKIETFISEIEQKELIQIQQEIKSNDNTLEKHLSNFKNVSEKVKKRGEKLKKNIDIHIATTLLQLKNLEDENTQLLTSYKTELEQKLAKLNDQLNQCKETLKTGTDIQVFDVTSSLNTDIKLPSRPVLGSAKFNTNKNPIEDLTTTFGKMLLTSPGQPDEHGLADSQLTRSSDQISSENMHSAQLASPIPKIMVLSECDSPCDIRCICPAIGGDAWTISLNGKTLTLLTNKGRVKQQIKCSKTVANICISPTTQKVWACSEEDNTVMEMKSGTILTTCTLVHKFNTKDEPKCLCVTEDDHILVGTANGITKYTPRGKQSLTTSSQTENTLVFTPRMIAECPVTKNVAVLDSDELYDDGRNEPAIVLLDKQLQQLYRYGTQQHIGWTGSQSFDPCSVTYDRRGQLVVADFSNGSLHLLSGDGEYLRLLFTDIHWPLAVCVDRQGVLWVACGDEYRTD